MYRLQYSSFHPVIVDVFFEEFSAYLELIILSSEPLLITGDFNIHVDVVGDPVSAKFLDLLEAMDVRQHVTTPTHQSGHTLDLIITRQCDALVKDPPVSDYHISDHRSVYIKIYRPRYEDAQLSVAKADDLLRSTTTSARRTNELLDKNEESYRY